MMLEYHIKRWSSVDSAQNPLVMENGDIGGDTYNVQALVNLESDEEAIKR